MLENNTCLPIPIIYPTETLVYTPGTDARIPIREFIELLPRLQEAPRY